MGQRGGPEVRSGKALLTTVRTLAFPINEMGASGWGSLGRGGSWDVAGSLGCRARADQRGQVEQRDQWEALGNPGRS